VSAESLSASAGFAETASELSFQVIGHPEPAGSKRAFQHPKTGRIVVTDAAKKSRPWKQEIAGAADVQMGLAGLGLFDGPLVVELLFVLARPKGHYGTGRNSRLVKSSAPVFPATRPDVDKLSRAVLDALTGTVYRDDAQIVVKVARKVYGLPERAEIRVRPA
jgi:Holliday junction resolvase RusA-like endonuclease